jgi:hypothetical protein
MALEANMTPGKVFLSYRRQDTAWFATALYEKLEPSFPERLFMDVAGGIKAGQDFVRVIEDQVRACDAMLVLIGPKWLIVSDEVGRRRLDSPEDFVRIEITSALRFGKWVIPVLLQETEMPNADALPEPLRDLTRRNAVGLTHERFTTDVQALIKAIENALVEAEATRQRAKAAADAAADEAKQKRRAQEAAQDPLSAKAQEILKRLMENSDGKALLEAKSLFAQLGNSALYETMGALAEAVRRYEPNNLQNQQLYAQYFINTGKATVAIDLLTRLAQSLPRDNPEFAEAMGLIGSANKQVFFDFGDKAAPPARAALQGAITAFRVPFEQGPAKNTWHGVNLVALLHRARRLGLQIAPDLSANQVAKVVVAELAAMPPEKRDPSWFLPTLAEASLALEDWDVVEKNIRAFAALDDVQAFQIESTLRQFTLVWDIESMDERGRGLVATLRARLLQLKGGEINPSPEDVVRWREQTPPSDKQLEEILGLEGPTTYRWWRTGLDRASSICSVRQKLGHRFGTGFLVKAGDLGLQPPDELVVLTNFHVVNREGAMNALTPQGAEIAFEAVDARNAWPVDLVLWQSPPDRHDAAVLRLKGAVAGVEPLPLAESLPEVTPHAKVYIIGHPGGHDLAFSFQDNELLDHEGPPGGSPCIPGVSRVHYRGQTEPGSSGSAVLDAKLWQVIALHHKRSDDLPKLNGKVGTYAANEGISILSIKQAIESGASMVTDLTMSGDSSDRTASERVVSSAGRSPNLE